MKNLILASVLMISSIIQTTTHADEVEPKCAKRAERAVSRFVKPGVYDKDGFEAYDCTLGANKRVMICEVVAAKGDGAAADTYRVVLNAECSRTFRVELIGEE